MPIYCYENGKEVVERLFPMGNAPDNIDIEGELFHRCFAAEHPPARAIIGNWPLFSEALGVNPSQVREAELDSIGQGVPTQFTKDGRAILTSQRHRKRYCEQYGFFDRNGSYGDPQRK